MAFFISIKNVRGCFLGGCLFVGFGLFWGFLCFFKGLMEGRVIMTYNELQYVCELFEISNTFLPIHSGEAIAKCMMKY